MPTTPLHQRSASELVALLRSGQLSSVTLVDAYLAQIRKWNPALNAVVSLREDEARAEAAAADKAAQRGEATGALHGLPILLKDGVRVRGVRSTFGGVPMYFQHRPASDCKLVARLREAGAIVLGRSNLPLMALDWQCSSPFLGTAQNPWDQQRTPGGSSGGAAAALAAGFTALELGSDLGGSIRYPAHCCGVLGLRTSDGLLPIDDIGPETERTIFHRLLTFGPMARTLEDLALMLDVLTGSQARPAPAPGKGAGGKLKVAVATRLSGAEPNAATSAAIASLVAGLRADGHEVREELTPAIDFADAYRVWGTIAGHEFASAAPWYLRNAVGRFLFCAYMLYYKLGRGPFTTWFKAGLTASPAAYERALADWREYLRIVDAFFAEWDLWILPVSRGEAIRKQRRGHPITVDGKTWSYSEYLGAYTVPTTPLGTPALTLPVGITPAGLPIGVQVHAARASDAQLLVTAQRELAKYVTVRCL